MREFATNIRFTGTTCPHCGKWSGVEPDEFAPCFEPDWVTLPLYCHNCGTTWNATYKFDHNEEVDVLEIKEGK